MIEVVANVDDHVDYKDIASIIKEKDDGFVRENPEMDFEFNEFEMVGFDKSALNRIKKSIKKYNNMMIIDFGFLFGEIKRKFELYKPHHEMYIEELDLKETSIISSYTLGKMMGISPSLIRQDFNASGEFGRQGHGYNLDTLKKEIGEFLGINKIHNMIVIGAGNLGQTLANYDGFAKVGFPIKGLFDINPKLIGMKINGIEIIDLDQLNSFIKDTNIDIGILCVRKHCVQQMTDILVDAGIKGIWNFSAIDIDVPDDVKVESVNFSNSLFTLSYLMNDKYTNQKS